MNDLTTGARDAEPGGEGGPHGTTGPAGPTDPTGATGATATGRGGPAGRDGGAPDRPSAGAPAWPPGHPPLGTTASIMIFGHLAWLGWVWLVAFVAVTGVTVGVGAFGELEWSLWHGAGASWQRYVIFAAGVTSIASFAPVLISNGLTRARLALSSVVTMVALAAAGAAVTAIGFLVEGVVFGLYDVTHAFDRGEPIGAGTVAGLAVEQALALAAAYLSGWLVAIGFYRYDVVRAVALVLPSLVPVALMDGLMAGSPLSMSAGSVGDNWEPHLAVTTLGGMAVLAVGAAIARRRTLEIALRG